MSTELTGIVYNSEYCEWSKAVLSKECFDLGAFRNLRFEDERALPEDISGESVLSISSQHAMLLVETFPLTDDRDELDGMIALHVDQVSPYPMEQTYYGYEVIGELADSYTVLLAIVPVKVLDEIKPDFRKVKYNISRIEVSCLGWLHLIKHKELLHEYGRQVFVILDEEFPEILIFQNGQLVAVRSLKTISGEKKDELEGEISQILLSLELEHGAVELAPEFTYVFSQNGPSGGTYKKLASEGTYQGRVLELSELGELLYGIVARQFENGKFLMDITPEVWKSEKNALVLRNRFIYAGVFVGLSWLFMVVIFVLGFSYQSKKISQLSALNAKLEPQAALVLSVGRRAGEMERYVNNRISSLECLREISELLPMGVELSAFSYKKTDGVRIAGMADNASMVYEFKDKLDKSDLFDDVDLQGPQADRRKKKEIFDVFLTLRDSEGGAR